MVVMDQCTRRIVGFGVHAGSVDGQRLIGSIRRELLDQTLFWTETDLENKLRNYKNYYNQHRCHSSREGVTPLSSGSTKAANINNYRWKKHCRGLFELPVAA
jgi:hypothetical protein